MTDQTDDEKGLKSLVVWQKTLQFAVFICKETTPKFPDEEKWALSNQLRRSAQSIPANLAEGYGRYYYQEGVHFAYIARGSLEETFSHLTLAQMMDYLDESEYQELCLKMDELRKLINGYINYLRKSKRGISELGANYSIDAVPSTFEQAE